MDAVLHIPEVEVELTLPGESVAAVDLGPARDARAQVVAASLLLESSARGRWLGVGVAQLGSFRRAAHSTVRAVRRDWWSVEISPMG